MGTVVSEINGLTENIATLNVRADSPQTVKRPDYWMSVTHSVAFARRLHPRK